MLWIGKSNRWKHILGGFVIGLASDSWWCAMLAGGVAGGSLELKDKLYGKKIDYIDFSLTLAGALIGYAVRFFVKRWLT